MISKARATEIRSLAREKMAEHNGLTLPVRPKFVAQKLDIVVMPFDPPMSLVTILFRGTRRRF